MSGGGSGALYRGGLDWYPVQGLLTPCRQTEQQTDATENITFATLLASGNE